MGWCSKLDVFEKPDNEVGGRRMKQIPWSCSRELVREISRSRFVRSRLVGSRLHGSDLVRPLISETRQGAGRVSPFMMLHTSGQCSRPRRSGISCFWSWAHGPHARSAWTGRISLTYRQTPIMFTLSWNLAMKSECNIRVQS